MPNNFGGDQYDPDYAPHMYNDKGEFESPDRKIVSPQPASDADSPAIAPTDKRIRSIVGEYRAVIPTGVQKGRRFHTNNSPVVIEKRSKDATGAEKWDCVTSFPKPGSKSSNEDADHAIYWLLAGPDAE